MLQSPLINGGDVSASDLLDSHPRLSKQQRAVIGLFSVSTFLFLTCIVTSPTILLASSSLLFCITLAWAIRNSLLEAQWQALMRDVTDCMDEDSIFTTIHASSDLQQSGNESIKVHYKAAHSIRPIQWILHCHHGFGSTCLSFEPFFSLLQKADCPISVTATAHDCPGFGLTERPKGENGLYSLTTSGKIGWIISKRQSSIMMEGLSHSGLDTDPPKRIYMGHSAGAIAAAREAIRLQREGQGLDALILIAPAIYSLSLPNKTMGQLVKSTLYKMSLVVNVASLLQVMRPLVVLIVRSLVRSNLFWTHGLGSAYHDQSKLTARMMENYRLASLVKGWEFGLCRFIESMLAHSFIDPDLVTELSSLTCPLFIIHGRQDKLVPLVNSSLLADKLKCKLVILEDCGHSPQEECPGNLLNTLLSFME